MTTITGTRHMWIDKIPVLLRSQYTSITGILIVFAVINIGITKYGSWNSEQIAALTDSVKRHNQSYEDKVNDMIRRESSRRQIVEAACRKIEKKGGSCFEN